MTFIERKSVIFEQLNKFRKDNFEYWAFDLKNKLLKNEVSSEEADLLSKNVHSFKDDLFFVIGKKTFFIKISDFQEKSSRLKLRLFLDFDLYFKRQKITLRELIFSQISVKLNVLYLIYKVSLKTHYSKQRHARVIISLNLTSKEFFYKFCYFLNSPQLSIIPKNKNAMHFFVNDEKRLININLKLKTDFVEIHEQSEMVETENFVLTSKVSKCGQFLIQIFRDLGLVVTRLNNFTELFNHKDKTLVDGEYELFDVLNKELNMRILV